MTDSRPVRPLYDAIAALAATPDDVPVVDELLMRIVSLVAALVTPVDYASVTAQRSGSPTTVATSHQTALAVDQAQYSDQSGPCLEALNDGVPVTADIATTMKWPGFRATADSLGLQASLSIPLFTGSGEPVAALNLYARDGGGLASLTEAVVKIFHSHQQSHPASEGMGHRAGGLGVDAGSAQLLAGIDEALSIQQSIHLALGILMQRDSVSSTAAYVALREQAAVSGLTLPEAAANVVTELAQD
jgi:hypothetical protein